MKEIDLENFGDIEISQDVCNDIEVECSNCRGKWANWSNNRS